jgi:thiopurine S-methyltransferase
VNEDFWINKWQKGEIGFHQAKYHPAVEKFGTRFSPGTVLVPLCGKTLDMLYFSSIGHSVIGVELSPIACRDFFVENGIQFTEKSVKDFAVFESEHITLWCGDFFKLPQDVWSTVKGIYDRAALVALPEDIRQKYAAEITKRSGTVEVLLVSFEYPQGSIQGPPFSVPEAEIKKIYQGFALQLIHSEQEEVRSTVVTESVYWLSKTKKD